MRNWLGQTTTGAGFATLIATFGAFATGALTWQQAIPLLAGGAAGLIWPENPGARAMTQQAASAMEAIVTSPATAGPHDVGGANTVVKPAV